MKQVYMYMYSKSRATDTHIKLASIALLPSGRRGKVLCGVGWKSKVVHVFVLMSVTLRKSNVYCK